MRFRKAAASLVFLVYGAANAAPEVIGTVYPVIEPDMVVWMKDQMSRQLTPERIEELKKERQEATRKYAERPTGRQLPRTQVPATRWFDPSMTVPYDLRDHEGRLIHAAGTTINPLDWRPLTRQLLFIDGDDGAQVAWAEAMGAKDSTRVKIILVSGAPLELGRKWQQQVYFDQKGLLVAKLDIQQVPALVSQDGRRLRIDEVQP
jgi:type-F conjugative transfer system protein TraW